jgi:TPR repeat protein
VLGRLRRCGGSDSDAMYALGALHSDLTQPPNLEAARHWFEQAANAGHVDSMYTLGFLYAKSMEPPDLDTARGWYQRAANAGHSGAMTAVDNL